ncbi:MAG: electron transfer flavoprotein subunit beta/FixA family protein [Candidatus Cloacimonadales bacterium]|nr:electron transfer flavoprotein subunit beta/FixA family protein [Candidatus Cloacimonadales bacterium]
MDIIVCIKRVPQTSESEVKIDSSGKDIEKDRLTFDTNESDTYALEQAVLIKEKFGGEITVLSLGEEDAEDTLRIALAKGADNAIRIKAEDFDELDGFQTSQILQTVIKTLNYDIIFTGCIATDDAYSQIGVTLAELLGIPHAALVIDFDVNKNRADVQRELEGGLLEHLDIALPALFTIQTGINEPRYASLIAIRRAAKKEIRVIGKQELQQAEFICNSVLEELYIPPISKQVEILTGSTAESASKLAGIIKEKGLL